MSALSKCYRCDSHLTMSESLESWCLTCSDTAQLRPLQPLKYYHLNEYRPSREKAVRS